jgi:hypothetical protein
MAQTHYVKAFRGQRNCQAPSGSYAVCGQPKAVHKKLDHEFTQKPLNCDHCGKPINIGDPYKWIAPRAHRAAQGIKRNRHTTCPAWRASQTTSSPHLATIYGAQEAAEDQISAVTADSAEDAADAEENLKGIAEEFAENIQEAVESYAESAQNIEDGFGHETYQSEELREKSEAIESWAEEVASYEVEEFIENLDCMDCGLEEAEGDHQDEDDDEYHEFEADTTAAGDWLEEQQDNLLGLIGEMPI